MNSLPQQAQPARFVSALCVGEAVTADLIAACHRERIGVIVSTRAMQLLRHFRADAVICLAADPNAVMALAGTNVPIILLASETWEWATPGVTVVSRDTPAAILARFIREAATGSSSRGSSAAA